METCTYCALPTAVVEEEHTFPESWYPDGVLRSQMLIVPSCPQCNDRYDKLEQRVRGRLALPLLGANDLHAKGVADRVLRSVNPARGKNARDARHRAGRLAQLRRQLSVAPPEEWNRVLPAGSRQSPTWLYDSRAEMWRFGLPSVQYDPNDLTALTEKFVRGIYRALHKKPLPSDVAIATPVMTTDPIRTLERLIKETGMRMVGAPGFSVWHGHQGGDDPDELSTLTLILVWGRIVLCGMTGAAAAGALEEGSPP